MKQFLVPALLLALVATTAAVAASSRSTPAGAVGKSQKISPPSEACAGEECCREKASRCCKDAGVQASEEGKASKCCKGAGEAKKE